MENSNSKKNIRRGVYRWHRILGILTAIPVILWTCSGLSHPFMAHYFKVDVAHEFTDPRPINKTQILLTLTDVLKQNKIQSLRNFRTVEFKGTTFYQLKDQRSNLAYYSAATGNVLQGGDRLYAEFLARYFLGDSISNVTSIEKITDFTDQYKYVNRYLPVWKVSFKREDKMDIYVETGQSRLANYNDNNRKAFLWIFGNFHSYEWLAKITNNTFRYIVLLFLAAIVIGSTISGLVVYGFMWKKFRKPVKSGQKLGFLRRNHRSIGIAVSLVTLSFIGSGAYHATRKFNPDDRVKYVFEPEIKASSLIVSPEKLPIDRKLVFNISLAKINDKSYYQVYTMATGKDTWKKQQVDRAETMFGEKKAAKPNVSYYDTATGEILQDGVMEHAYSLVKHFVAQGAADGQAACCEMMANIAVDRSAPLSIIATDYLVKFDKEYGFINKRLPVVKFALNTPGHLTYYVEPSTGRMAARLEDGDRREGFSFALFHKFFLVDFAGKNIRDLVTVISALGVLVVAF